MGMCRFADFGDRLYIGSNLSNQYIKSLIRLEQLSKLKEITYKDYIRLFGGGERNAYNCLLTLVKLGFLERVKVKRLYNQYLTEKGKKFLKVIETIQKEIK